MDITKMTDEELAEVAKADFARVGSQGRYYEYIDAARLIRQCVKDSTSELQTVLDAWYSIFGTSQLSHAQARLEVAEEKAKKYDSQPELERWSVKKIKNIIEDWLSCGESRLSPDDVIEIAEAIHAAQGRKRKD